MHRLALSDQEIATIQALLGDLRARYDSAEHPEFLRNAGIYAHDLPRRLRAFLNDFKLLEQSAICVIAGYPIDDTAIGRTPAHWNARAAVSPTLAEELLFMLCGALLGDAFAWSTQQGGYLVHDILPIKGHEYDQLGSGSAETLEWHTEEAFHPYKCDYLGLMCLRNPEQVPTTFVSTDMLPIKLSELPILFEPRYTIRPDESHLQKNQAGLQQQLRESQDALDRAYRRVEQINTKPQKVPVLLGDPNDPYLCIDPFFMDRLADDEAAQQALDTLIQTINANLSAVTLQPGDCCFIDNYRAVHGRKSFSAKYDGTDRWLKRINITRDLRKSRGARQSSESRIIF
jgi:Fe(II)/alpha-ketoglutarate-dependent arginine beta-hydroxylase